MAKPDSGSAEDFGVGGTAKSSVKPKNLQKWLQTWVVRNSVNAAGIFARPKMLPFNLVVKDISKLVERQDRAGHTDLT